MKTVYKYHLNDEAETVIQVPPGEKILNVGFDAAGRKSLWALVDTSFKPRPIVIYQLGTGWPLNEAVELDQLEYINSLRDGEYIWHYFRKMWGK